MKKIEINVEHENLINPHAMITHVHSFMNGTEESIPNHTELLTRLLEQIEPIDYESIAFPEMRELRNQLKSGTVNSEKVKEIESKVDKVKLGTKHFLIISIDEILKIASLSNWSMCKKHDFIYLYNGNYWSEVDKDTFQRFLGEASEKLGVQAYTSKHYQFREQLFKQFLSTAVLPVPPLNDDKVLINLKNGTFEIELEKNQLKKFRSEDFLTYQLPFSYDATAKAPLFTAYLNKVLPDVKRQHILAEFMGFVFLKNGNSVLKEEKALILYGSGANGKSVFFEIMNALLGQENISSYSLQSLTNENGYYRAKIANKLVNYASEINGKLEASIFKQLVSGEPVEARLPYGQPFILKQYAKLIFNCNELPKDVEQTDAFFRRFLIIPFDVTIPENEQDKQLHKKIIDSELSGVFNWILEGLQRLLKQRKFTYCEAVDKMVQQYRIESDSVLMYLTDNNFEPSLSKILTLKDVYYDYRNYCYEGGFKPCSLRECSSRLRKAKYIIERKTQGNVIYIEKKDCF
ncbi:DNA primase family protein [Flectobacillus longus]|uniref:DNA primase family protein n=1 Tax=Flectobacillus longus TaxID=2984207 RepID=UPI0024B6ACD7|nr:phage/plasmid primase, P4 family [Flectobacillus longus]MDI9878060.1 phage/plasmid primase, P4 family [Flectobacillus longus]